MRGNRWMHAKLINKRLLITGASGFIGKNLLESLENKVESIIATYKKGPIPQNLKSRIRWVKNPSAEMMYDLVQENKINVILHLASPRANSGEKDEFYMTNCTMTENLLKISQSAKVDHFIFCSTGSVCNESCMELPDGFCPDLSSKSDYTNSKAIGEMYTRRYGTTLNTLIFRIFHPYGKHGDYFLVNKLVKLIRNEELITIHGKYGPLLNPVSVKDVCKAFELSMIQRKTGVINVGGPSYLTLHELVKKIAHCLDVKLVKEHLKEKSDKNHACSIKYLAKYLNWSPQITIDEGLVDIYKNK